MSMQDYEQAIELLQSYPKVVSCAGPRPEFLVQAAERALGLKFPPTYRRFLLEFGAGGIGAEDIYGVIDENFEDSCVPDAIWYTLQERKDWGLPHNWVVIHSVGDGELFCLDFGRLENSEVPVINYQPGYPPEKQHPEIIAKDFGEFFLELVKRQINHQIGQVE